MLRSLFAFLIILLMMKGQEIQSQPLYNRMVLEEMVSFNEKMKTDRLMVSVGDSLIADVTYRGRKDDRYLVYSITKVFSGIAVGIMIDQQLISSAEVPVSAFFPDWGQDSLKKMITIRHILQHSSGLESGTGSRDIYPQPDYVQFALNSAVISTPGLRFFYNNKAINIISGIVNKATGKSLEDFI